MSPDEEKNVKLLSDANDRLAYKLKELTASEQAMIDLAHSLADLVRICDEAQKDYDEYIQEMSLGGRTYQPR